MLGVLHRFALLTIVRYVLELRAVLSLLRFQLTYSLSAVRSSNCCARCRLRSSAATFGCFGGNVHRH